MSKIIDLTWEITDYMSVYPGDRETRLYQYKTLDKDGYNGYRLESGMHSGTHIDAPFHLIEEGKDISEFPLESFIGTGCILDVRNEKIVKMKDEYLESIENKSIVLLYTGHGQKFGKDEYFTDFPVIDTDLANFFVSKGIKMLGMDMPSPDKFPFEIHNILLMNGILIAENLTNLEQLLEVRRFEVIALPLKISAEGSLARVVARIDKKI